MTAVLESGRSLLIRPYSYQIVSDSDSVRISFAVLFDVSFSLR